MSYTIKKTTARQTVHGERGSESTTMAAYGVYNDSELIARISGERSGYRGVTTWEVMSGDGLRTYQTFKKLKDAKNWASENAEYIAVLGPSPGPGASKKLRVLQGHRKVGGVWVKESVKDQMLELLESSQLSEGDIIEVELERRVIYANAKHIPASRTSKKKFKVGTKGPYGWSLRQIPKQKKVRGWRLSSSQERLESFTRPPVSYDVMNVKVVK